MFECLPPNTDIAKRYSHPPKDVVSPDIPLVKGDSESSEDNDVVTTLTEKIDMPKGPQLADDLTEIEEQYIAAEYTYQQLTAEEKVRELYYLL